MTLSIYMYVCVCVCVWVKKACINLYYQAKVKVVKNNVLEKLRNQKKGVPVN